MQNSDLTIHHRGGRMIASDSAGAGWPVTLQLTFAAIGRVWTGARERRALMDMPDHLLRDIGLERDSLHRVVGGEKL